MAEPIVHVVDDDEAVRSTIIALASGMSAKVEAYVSAEDFLERAPEDAHGCIITDIRMSGMSGLELLERLIERGIAMPIVVMSGYATTQIAVRAMRSGALTVLEKPFDEHQLWEAIRDAMSRCASVHAEGLRRKRMRAALESLSEGERQVLDKVIEGLPNKAIAYDLGVSIRTVESRRQRVMQKLEAESVADLVRAALDGAPREGAPRRSA